MTEKQIQLKEAFYEAIAIAKRNASPALREWAEGLGFSIQTALREVGEGNLHGADQEKVDEWMKEWELLTATARSIQCEMEDIALKNIKAKAYKRAKDIAEITGGLDEATVIALAVKACSQEDGDPPFEPWPIEVDDGVLTVTVRQHVNNPFLLKWEKGETNWKVRGGSVPPPGKNYAAWGV